ncbi:hypothetical protein ARMGADRAFT_1005567 [Armillaria gallica]|uniref:Uncharacterized protein n=1 Tax=Armillaria gallica TaxID=47427 RepID=A0A2H3E7L2_ARMGA|nr:hypothetical protein ARMGADRAFT_1005567 [Armillaria gallica]
MTSRLHVFPQNPNPKRSTSLSMTSLGILPQPPFYVELHMHDQPSSKMPSHSSSSFDDGSSCEYSFTMIPNTKTSPIHACDASELAHFILVRAGCYMRIGRMNYVVRRVLVDGMCLSVMRKGRPRRREASSLLICVQDQLAKTERHSSSVIWQWKETAAKHKYGLGCLRCCVRVRTQN